MLKLLNKKQVHINKSNVSQVSITSVLQYHKSNPSSGDKSATAKRNPFGSQSIQQKNQRKMGNLSTIKKERKTKRKVYKTEILVIR